MEGKPSVGSSSSASNSTKITSGKEFGKESSSGLFKSVFPPASTVMRRDSSSSDIFEPSRKQESAGGSSIGHNFIMKGTGSIYQNEKTDPCHLSSSLYYGAQDVYTSHPSSIGHNFIMKGTGSIYQNEKTDPCHLSSSLYYGAQDVYTSHPSTSYVYKSTDNYKKDVTNNSGSSRGDWWEGSLYY